jgi:chemotaxis protein histidine kinase CheA
MKIYEAEIMAGLSHSLSAQSSIVYASLAEKCDYDSSDIAQKIKQNQSLASINDSDLYYTQSILVTTSWNKNDDIFDAKEVWAAKKTPEDKPTNLEHDEKTIVGHITSNWPIDENGNIIDENISEDSIPEKYHILTGSVIYRGYTDQELKERASNLINEIENGQKYVSMECFFKNFDYGLVDKATGSYQILPRNEETAFLTKHLRAYGGQGEHQNYKVGRVLRNITFSGKGFVDKPANPESIIFSKDLLPVENLIEKSNDSTDKGVFSNQANLKETTMSIEAEVPQTETEIMTEAQVEQPTTDVVAEEAVEINLHEEAAKKMEEEMKKKDEEMKKMKAALELVQAELNSANESLAGYKSKEEEMMKKDKKAKRMASLVESGLDTETAEATVEKFESLDDETFAAVTSLVAAKKSTTEDPKNKFEEEMTEKKKASETEVDASVLETAEVEESVNLSISSEAEDSEIQSTRAALVDFVCNRLGKKQLNKGE